MQKEHSSIRVKKLLYAYINSNIKKTILPNNPKRPLTVLGRRKMKNTIEQQTVYLNGRDVF